MSTNSCILKPKAPNSEEESKLYQNLLKRLKDRPLANFIYAVYRTNNTADNMDRAGLQRNAQKEHNVDDVISFLDVNAIQAEFGTLASAELQSGFIDTNGNRVDFSDAEDALHKADDFNSNHKGLVATVVQSGDVFNVIVSEKNSKTHAFSDSVKNRLQTWDIYKQAFRSVGVDITALPQELRGVVNATNSGLAQYLRNLPAVTLSSLYKRDALLLFSLSPSSPKVLNAAAMFGSIDAAAQAVDDFNHGAISLTSAQQTVLKRAVNEAKKYMGIDIDALVSQVRQASKNFLDNSPVQNVKKELHELNKKYNIDVNENHRIGKKIKTLSDVAADIAVNLKRQIRQLEKVRGNNAEGRRLERVLNSLMGELASKRYYSGVLSFLGEASAQIQNIDAMLQNIPQTGTELEKACSTARVLQDIKSLYEQYYPLVSALANENLIIDEFISHVDIDNIRQTAKSLKEFFDKKDKFLDELTESTMMNIMMQIVGNEKNPDGQAAVNAVRMAASDSSKIDFLYSVGRASNPVIGAMGSIIRNAQDSRDGKMNDIALRIRRATNRLYASKSTSEFMYEDDGHIISDIDWKLYEEAQQTEKKALIAQGLRGFDLKQALEDWEDLNTEDRVVDASNGRTERVPNASYRKQYDFKDKLSSAQVEYYDTMMQLKGEIGSLLPSYAQRQYLPPQLRRKFLDALADSKDIKDVGRAVRNKLQDFYKVREDDENYNDNGIIDGEEYQVTEGAFDNTPLRQIPIFFVNRVEEGELLKNFSSGLQALAGTAINYDAMNEVAQVVEFIGDFAKNQTTRDADPKGDVVQNKQIRVFKDLWKRGINSNTTALVDGFIAQHIYGQHRDPEENKVWSKIFSSIIGYTSFKGLATNVKGALANYLMGELQMLIEAGAGEFYGFKDYAWAHSRLFGAAGVSGEIAELLTNNVNHKSVLMRELFDPLNKNFSQKSHTKYYPSMFRQLVSHDCSFIGYSSGEYLIHYVNMYSLLHNQKVLLNGKTVSLYDAFEVTDKQDGNSRLQLKPGVTLLDGSAVTKDFLDNIRRKLRYLNQSTHGATNDEDKGLLHQKWWGRGIMNFRQWMVEHYSRRFRKNHFDATLGTNREGYWYTLYKGLVNEDTKDSWNKGNAVEAMGMFMHDLYTFMFRSQAQWHNLNEMQKHNIRRVRAEMLMYVCLLGLSFALGEPDRHKKEFWRRWWIYQTKRAILDTEASMPHPKFLQNTVTILQSPMASITTMSSLLYALYGLGNGDLFEKIKSGEHKGENKYWRNIKKYDLPFFKDWEQLQNMDTSDAIFKVFETSPSNH